MGEQTLAEYLFHLFLCLFLRCCYCCCCFSSVVWSCVSVACDVFSFVGSVTQCRCGRGEKNEANSKRMSQGEHVYADLCWSNGTTLCWKLITNTLAAFVNKEKWCLASLLPNAFHPVISIHWYLYVLDVVSLRSSMPFLFILFSFCVCVLKMQYHWHTHRM